MTSEKIVAFVFPRNTSGTFDLVLKVRAKVTVHGADGKPLLDEFGKKVYRQGWKALAVGTKNEDGSTFWLPLDSREGRAEGFTTPKPRLSKKAEQQPELPLAGVVVR